MTQNVTGGTPEPDRAAQLTALERRLAEARGQVRELTGQNERLSATLSQARERLTQVRAEVEQMAQPPVSFGILDQIVEAARTGAEPLVHADVWLGARKLRVSVAPEVDQAMLTPGAEVVLNEAHVVVDAFAPIAVGDVAVLKDVLEDGHRAVVVAQADEEHVVRLADQLRGQTLRPGDSLLVDRRILYAFDVVPKVDVEDLVLEEVPDVEYTSIGGLGRQIEQIQDAVELPFLHRDLFAEFELAPPKGILLYGPPGCGKTMIAKAVANSLARKVTETTGREGRSWFLNIKGPELLNKYVGETERHIRLIFTRARDKASEGMPVIVFFDEMDSLFRTRGSGVSSDVENTIVPQLLAEIDGVEGLDNVIIVGASNREDMIDPAILRPGRLDVKIKIERPDAEAAREIFDKYLSATLPLNPDDLAEFDNDPARCRAAMIDRTVEHMYADSDDNRFLEVTYAGGDTEVLYFRDFNSGAMINNIVGRAKKLAIKERLATGVGGIRIQHLLQACTDEFAENEDLPNTTNPDDWARISGKKGERIVHVRTLFTSKQATDRAVENISTTGQYL
ncbi:proteasome ATPase [Naumannella cuiyingiana]|uniref:AAA ATPase forming ring-shaped complexes n=1 Tax=Naumannella cuiyingiana TaxID=1347891 RepID=A0A7Z0D610_9ACTN|nr:proteasome ATPase [Naumannella cuiyingiana]NYI69518.1 proteasome-associated ATPase [Naumannella cuiyingiana]